MAGSTNHLDERGKSPVVGTGARKVELIVLEGSVSSGQNTQPKAKMTEYSPGC